MVRYRKRISIMFRKIGIFLFWIFVWFVLALLVDNPILLVTPKDAFVRLFELVLELSFWHIVLYSLLRIGAGFLLGFFVALVLAVISMRFRWVEELLRPLMNLVKAVPVASFVVLLLIWWGSSVLAVAICFLVVLPNIYINTLEGLKATDVRLLEMAEVFQMSAQNRFLYIYRSSLRPFLESGLRISLGMCWKSGVAAEVIGTPEYSIGGHMYLSKIHLDTSGVLAWTIVIIFLSVIFEKCICYFAGCFFEWNPNPGSVQRKRKKSTKFQEIKMVCVNKVYGAQRVLSDVSAVYEAGKTYYLTSPSGSGKTTLLRVICGLEQADSGIIEGKACYSMVFQEDRLCEDYNAIQNVAMVTGDEQSARQALQGLLEAEALTKPCRQLSGGMKRRVALVRAMESDSDVVLLDEPFTGMDAENKKAAEKYIFQRQNGRMLIIATHI